MKREIAGLGLKNSLRRKRVLALTLFSIAISVSLLYTAFSASASLQYSANMFLKNSLSPMDVQIRSIRWFEPITADMRDSISGLTEVAHIFPRIEETAQLDNMNSPVFVSLVAIDVGAESVVGSLNATDGTASLTGKGCFLTLEAKEILNKSVGDELTLYTTAGLQFFNVTGYGIAIDKGVLGPTVFISIQQAWENYHIRFHDNSTNRLYLELKDVFLADSVVRHLTAQLGEGYVAVSLKTYQTGVASVFLDRGRLVLFALVAAASFVAVFRVFSSFASLFGQRKYEIGILLAFGSTRSQVTTVLLSEVGVVGLVGAALGGAMGLGMGYITLNFWVVLLRISIIGRGPGMFGLAYAFDMQSLLLSVIMGIVLTLLGGAIPAIRASGQPIVSSLTSGVSSFAPPTQVLSPVVRRRIQLVVTLVSGSTLTVVLVQLLSDLLNLHIISQDALRVMSIPVMLLVAAAVSPKVCASQRVLRALLFRSKQVVGYLSSRNLKRTLLTSLVVFNLFAAATVLFVASTNVGHVISYSWETSMSGQVTTTNVVAYLEPPRGSETLDEIRGLSNVTSAVGINQAVEYIVLNRQSALTLVMGVETNDFLRLASTTLVQSVNQSQGFGILDKASTCIISEYSAEEYQLGIGDHAVTPSGANLTIVGVCVSSVPIYVVTAIADNIVIMGSQTWADCYGDGVFEASTVLVETTDIPMTMTDLDAIPGVRPILVSGLQTDYASALEMVNAVVGASLFMLFVSTTLSALLTGFSVVSARRREMGLLLSMGVSEDEVAGIVTAETATSMATGVAAGFVAGITVELAIRDMVMRFGGGSFVLLDVNTALLIVLSLIASVLAVSWGTKRACQRTVTSLLRDSTRVTSSKPKKKRLFGTGQNESDEPKCQQT